MDVNIGKNSNDKSFFPISFDSSSSINFGEVLPFFCHEVVPDSHVNVDLGQAVRFSPLSFPTFGKADLKTFLYNHRLVDLYPPFNDLLAQTPFTTGTGSTYIPQEVPSLPTYLLWLSVFCQGSFNLFKGTGKVSASDYYGIYSPGAFTVPEDSPLYLSSLNFTPLKIGVGSSVSDINLDSDFPASGVDNLQEVNSNLSRSLIAMLANSLSSSDFFNKFCSGLSESILLDDDELGTLIGYLFQNPSDVTDQFVSDLSNNVLSSRFDDSVEIGSCDLIFPLSFTSKPGDSAPCLPGYGLVGSVSNLSTRFSSTLFTLGNELAHEVVTEDNVCVFVGVRLNNSGKFLRKLFMGLGYQLAPISTHVSLLPLYGYFKSYFDSFAPKRFVKFEQSFFARFMNVCVNSGNSAFQILTSLTERDFGWSSILDDLFSCYYTKNTDYYSAQIIGLINDYGGDLSRSLLSPNTSGAIFSEKISSDVSDNVPPRIDFAKRVDSGYVSHTQAQQNILSRLTQFVNRRSAIGAKLSELLSSVFGISPKTVDEYNSYVGSYRIDVEFGDVFSTAETAEGSLGEFAGKAIGSGRSDKFSVNTDTFTLLIGVQTLVPRTQYVNGINPLLTHVGYNDFYNPLYDGLTLLPSRRSSLLAPSSFFPIKDSSFGNIPIYTEYKTKSQGILSGDLSLPSTRSSFDSFTLDEVLDGYSYVENFNDSTGSFSVLNTCAPFFGHLVAGTMWRYLGRWLWLGRFDRIFVNNRFSYDDFISSIGNTPSLFSTSSIRDFSRSDDNVIVHNIVDLSINSPMLPMADSFMTQDIDRLSRFGISTPTE